MRVRSIVSITAGGAGLTDALNSKPDAVLLTLADDSRPIAELRESARAALSQAGEAGVTAFVTVNHPRTKLLRDDIDAVLSSLVNGIVLPHSVEPQDVRDVAVLLREFELHRGIEPGETQVFPVMDTARGLLRAAEIASAAPRVGGLVFHSRNYAHDVFARDEQRGDRLAYARGQVVAVSRAFGQQPLIVADGLELQYLSQYGFAGAILPDGRMVPSANALFSANEAEQRRAKEALERYDAARSEGAWVARYGERVIDGSTARAARRALE